MASSNLVLVLPLEQRLCRTFHAQKSRVQGNGSTIVCHSRGKGGADSHGRAKLKAVTQRMRLLLESEGLLATEAAYSLVNSMNSEGRTALISALFPATQQAVDYFEQADANADGMVDAAEFARFVEIQAHFFEDSNKPLTTDQLYHLSSRAAIGNEAAQLPTRDRMIGFGFTDNAIMILAGDVIQNTIGLTLGLSTLMSAGLGNAVADLIGTAFRGYIERLSGNFMPEVKITSLQLESKEAWWAETVGASAGVTLGCLLGLAPLLILHQKQEKAATGTSVIADKQETSVVCSSNGGTAFATISTLASPCRNPGHGMAQTTVGGSVFILMVSAAMAVKRVQMFMKSRRN